MLVIYCFDYGCTNNFFIKKLSIQLLDYELSDNYLSIYAKRFIFVSLLFYNLLLV